MLYFNEQNSFSSPEEFYTHFHYKEKSANFFPREMQKCPNDNELNARNEASGDKLGLSAPSDKSRKQGRHSIKVKGGVGDNTPKTRGIAWDAKKRREVSHLI